MPTILFGGEHRLYIHVPILAKAYIVQDKISSLCPDISVTVFGRSKDFYNTMKVVPPDAILSLPIVIQQQKEAFKLVFQGYRNNLPDEDYLLVSVTPIDVDVLNDKTIGVIDILGRKAMNQFMIHLFKQKIKLNRVIKRMDLLPLLSFNLVDAIFVSNQEFLRLQTDTRLELLSTPLDLRLGLVGFALRNNQELDNKKKYYECIKKFDGNLNLIFGVDHWQVLP